MAIESTFEIMGQFADRIGSAIDGLPIPANNRNRAAAGCLHLSLEHHGSIYLLLSKGQSGSAMALLRPQMESFIRGAWLFNSASDEDVSSFLDDVNPPSPSTMIQLLESQGAFNEGMISGLKKKLWDGLCSYTHGGGMHVVRRNTSDEITQNYHDQELNEAVAVSNLFALVSGIEIAAMANSQPSMEAITTAYESSRTCISGP